MVFLVGTILFKLAIRGFLQLSKSFLDPFGNEDSLSENFNVHCLICETNAGSTRWRDGIDELPFDAKGEAKGDAKAGFASFQQYCQVCHGANASGRYLPDLKRSQILLSDENWSSVVLYGALAPRGMAGFSRYLSEADAENIRAYVLAEARRGAAAPVATAGR